MNIEKSEIAIITTVSNIELYNKSLKYHPEGIDRIMIDGRKGLYGMESIIFMFEKLKKTNYKWIIMVDEDVFFIKPKLVFDQINYMNKNNYTISGLRDGGVVNHRTYNPFAMNTFFLIINYEKLKPIWNKKEVLNTHKIDNKKMLSLNNLEYDFDVNSSFELYYPFFFWVLNKNNRLLYLETKSPFKKNDVYSNAVYDHRKNTILVHSWFARAYGKYEEHTKRIDELIETTMQRTNLNDNISYVVWKNLYFTFMFNLRRIIKRIKNSKF